MPIGKIISNVLLSILSENRFKKLTADWIRKLKYLKNINTPNITMIDDIKMAFLPFWLLTYSMPIEAK